MKYTEYLSRETFSHEELIAHAYGRLVEDASTPIARLPTPPFLMFDRITELKRGTRGRIVAEQDIRLDSWYFQCHFVGDPVQPGCLGLDAIWQLIGFYISVNGSPGTGRALGCNEVEFSGQIRPHNKLVRYEIDIVRYTRIKGADASMAIGDGQVFVDGEQIYTIKEAKVGCFVGIDYPDYPFLSKNAVGGVMKR